MNAIHDFFTGNFLFNLCSFCFAIISIIVSIIFFYKSRKTKLPFYCARTISLLKTKASNIDKLEIKYDGKELTDFSTSKIAFWNAGKETIKSEDVSNIDPISLEVNGDIKILDCEIVQQTKKANNFKIEQRDNKVYINFDYLDKDDGVLLKIHHSGEGFLYISGSIQGVDSIKISTAYYREQSDGSPQKILRASNVHAFMAVFCLIIVIFHIYKISQYDSIIENFTSFIDIFICILYIITGISCIVIRQRNHNIPKSLEKKYLNNDF